MPQAFNGYMTVDKEAQKYAPVYICTNNSYIPRPSTPVEYITPPEAKCCIIL